MHVYELNANFLFFHLPDLDLKHKLEEREILIRDCSKMYSLDEDYHRVLINTHEENEYLVEALSEILNEMNQS